MPRIQYVSSRGIYHFHDTDAPTRTIPIGSVPLEQKVQKSVGGAASRVQPPPLRAIVLNKTVTTSPLKAMAPHAGVVDLTGISDDETPRGTARTRPSGQPALNSGRKSSVKYVKPPKSKAANNATSPRPRVIEKIDLSLDASPSRNATKSRQLTSANSKAYMNRESLGSQDAQNRISRQFSNRPSESMESAREDSQKRISRTMVIDDDDEAELPALPATFKRPRGLEERDSQPSTKPTLGSPFDGSSAVRPKRRKEMDSPLEVPLLSKRRKIGHHSTKALSISSTESTTKGLSKGRNSTRGDLPKQRSSLKSNKLSAADTEPIDLISPPRNSQKSRAFDRQALDRPTSTQNEKTKTSMGTINGERTPALQPAKRASDRLLTSDPDTIPRNFSESQQDSPEPSQDLDTQIGLSGFVAALTDDSNDDEDSVNKQSARWPWPSNRDTTPRRRKETAKAQALSASKKAKPQSDPVNRTPGSRERESRLQTPDQPSANGSVKQSSQKPSRNARQDGSVAGSDDQQAATQKPPAAAQTAKAKRRASSEDDPGYGSLSSSAGEGPRGVEMNIQGRVTPNVDTQAELAPLASHIVETAINGEKSLSSASEVTPRVQEPSASVIDGGAGRLGAKETPSKSPRSRKSPSRATQSRQSTPRTPFAKTRPTNDGSDRSSPAANGLHSGTADNTESPKPVPVRSKTSAGHANTVADEADLQLRSEAMRDVGPDGGAREPDMTFARPISAASAMKPPSIYSHLPLANQVEKVLGKYLEELREDNEYWTSVSMKRARLAKEEERNSKFSDASALQTEEPTSFADLRPIKLLPQTKSSSTKSDQVWGIQRLGPSVKISGPTWVSAPYVTFKSDTPDVPNYAHYVSIKNNILAPNVTNLHCCPYFGDDFDMSAAQNLEDQYNMDIAARERKLLLMLKAQKFEEYVESALKDLCCSWADVLRFLLEFRPDIGSDLGARKALQNRDEFCDEDFSRTAERWQTVLSTLPPSNSEKLARAAVLCDNFQKMAKFSLWHVARRNDLVKLPEEAQTATKVQPSDNALTCRICLRFNCPYHGELREHPEDESDGESGSAIDSVVATDLVHPQKVNYRTRVAFPPSCNDEPDSKEESTARSDRKDPKYWRSGIFHHLADERGPFYSCHHPGTSCEDANCSCYVNKIPCEKICSCSLDCRRKFQGCGCSTNRFKKSHKGCFEDERCACFQLGRECDPDLCGTCGVCEVVDPVNKYDDGVLIGRCRNCSIQRGVPKQTLLGDSGVHGLGLYACENIREHDFVGEYKGEIITKEEAERRGAVYEHQKLSYLFSLNATQEIDSTYFGNKVRFINHASGHKANLYPRIIMVNTVHRIALYANCSVRPGEELLFDYGPKFPEDQLGGKKSKKSAPQVRNSNLVRTFLDVEESEDEVGNMRAKGVSRPSYARNDVKTDKTKNPRGGARPGAGRKPHVPREYDETGSVAMDTDQDAEKRLAKYNLSDEIRSDVIDLDMDDGTEDDEAFEPPNGSESDDSEDSDVREEGDFDDEDDDEGPERGRSGRRRFGLSTRRA